MQKLYEDLRNKADKYYREFEITDENLFIESLDTFVNAKAFDSIVEANDYRNKVLIVLNEDLYGSLINLPENYNQFEILLHKFFNKKISNPIKILVSEIDLDLKRNDEDRVHSADEWDSMLEYASKLGAFWDGHSELSIGEIYNNIYESFPRTNLLRHLNYGLNPQHLKDLDESLVDTLEKLRYLEDAEGSLTEISDVEQLYQLKYFEPNVYAEMLSDEIEFLQTGIEPVDIVIVDDDEGQEVVD